MKRATSVLLSAVIIALAPGLGCYEALGQTIVVGGGQVGRTPVSVPVVPNAVGSMPVEFNPALPSGLSLPSLGAPSALPSVNQAAPYAAAVPGWGGVPGLPSMPATPGLPSLPGVPSLPAALSVPILPAPAAGLAAAPGAQAGPGTAATPVTTRAVLDSGVERLSKADDDGQRAQVLSEIFNGRSRTSSDLTGPIPRFSPAEGTAGSLLPAPGVSGAGVPHPLKTGSGQPSAPAAPVSLDELEAVAVDSAKPEAERKKAVESIAAQNDTRTEDSLRRVAQANPEGGASDYEVHRWALRALAGKGVILSLRPVSPGHAQQILAKLSTNRPDLAIFDYDDTLAGWAKPLAPETAAALKAAADAGVQPVILTDRPDQSDNPKEKTILDSIARMTPEQKASLGVVSTKGTRALVYDGKTEAQLIRDVDVKWSDAEVGIIKAAGQAVSGRYGDTVFNGRSEEISGHSYFRTLPVGMSEAEVTAAAEFMRAELKARGLDLEVVGRLAKNPANPPYLSFSKVDKSIGVSWLRTHLGLIGRLRDLARFGVRGKAFRKLAGFLEPLRGREVPVGKMLIVGDQFFGSRLTDRNMLKAAQGALALSVGGSADPRLDNTFVWPTEGGPASTEILHAVAAKPASDFNKKAVISLFASRTLSIASFILTSIAYPFLAAPAVGWAVYGVLMALGPLAAIATGPLNGSLADKLSARSSMTINMVVRGVLTLMLPAFAYFGVLNFWTLLLSSIANGWVLSAVMTTENAYIRRIAGHHQGTVTALASIHYVGMQTVLGLIVGIGSVIDKWNPMIAFVISAAVHALVLAPMMFMTMPNDKPQGSTAPQAQQAEKPGLAARWSTLKALVPEFLRKYWKEALLVAASIGAYSLLHSPLPIAAALLFWVWRSDTVKDIRAGKTRELSAREKELDLLLKENAAADQLDRSEIERLKAEKAAGWEARVAEIEGVLAKRAGQTKELAAESKRWSGRQFWAILYSALQGAMTYPFQNFALPLIATTLVGTAGKAMLLGKLTGAVFFGNLIANSSQANLPDIRLPLIGKFSAKRLVQGAVLALAGTWVYTGLLPGSILAAGAAVAIAAGLMWLANFVTHRGWIKSLGIGLLAAAWLPFMVWTGILPFMSVQTALFLGMLIYGMFTGPSVISFNQYLQTNTKKTDLGKIFGTSGSFINTSTSFGYGALSLAAAGLATAFPALLAPIGIAYAVAALAFWRAPKRLPGLPESSIDKSAKK
ncbi:MAG: MFS transporter [Elusimicrobia bacterium]|nr:MFS transporter [Elusimicrobiota bacterium]